MSRLITLTALALTAFATVPALHAANFQVDGSHAFATFKVGHLGIGNTVGRFNDISGEVDLDNGKIEITIRTASVDTQDEKRDQHLKGPDFFNVKQFPVMKFKATSVKPAGNDRFRVEGKMTIRGKSKNISLELIKIGEGKDPWGGYRLGFESTFTVKREDFGLDFMPGGIGSEVEIYVSLEALKK